MYNTIIVEYKYNILCYYYSQGLQSYNNVIFDKKRLKFVNVLLTESDNQK